MAYLKVFANKQEVSFSCPVCNIALEMGPYFTSFEHYGSHHHRHLTTKGQCSRCKAQVYLNLPIGVNTHWDRNILHIKALEEGNAEPGTL